MVLSERDGLNLRQTPHLWWADRVSLSLGRRGVPDGCSCDSVSDESAPTDWGVNVTRANAATSGHSAGVTESSPETPHSQVTVLHLHSDQCLAYDMETSISSADAVTVFVRGTVCG